MRKAILAPLTGALIIIVFLVGCVSIPPSGGASADPQQLLIPRWFLSELTLNGQKVDIPAGQQKITIQFEEGGKVNGSGGCNSFGGAYTANPDGSLTFSQLTSTLMACDEGMQQETAYLEALSKVQQFKVEEGKLMLSSTDGKNLLIFTMPPK